MPPPFKRLTLAEFALLLERFPFTRRINSVHMHHTWRPNHAQFRGHDSVVSMWRFHTEERHFSDIAQHLTIAPDGGLWTGRNWNAGPASASGYNGNAVSGPFMIEVVGDFDRGMDVLVDPQRTATLDVIKRLLTRFGLTPEAVMFHNQMAAKSCPGSAIVRSDFLQEVRQHTPAAAAGGGRRAARGPFGDEALAGNATVAQATALLTAGPGVGAADPPEAELDYGDESHRALISDAASRGAGDELSTQAIERLRPHVVNLRMGQFSSEGRMTTTAQEVDALFEEHLPRWVAAREDPGVPARIVLYAHGGLTSESAGLAAASRTRDWWLRNGVYPIYFIWETGLFQTLGDLLLRVKRKSQPEGERDFADWVTDPILEEAVRALQGPRIWGGMKASAWLASAPDGGASYVARALGRFQQRHGAQTELHAVGHSAGSIFQAHFLAACKTVGAGAFETLQLLAPAITCHDFQQHVVPLSGPDGVIRHTTIFTMSRGYERADNCAQIYRKSLLYLVKEACEVERKTPILGLEDSLRADAQLKAFFGLGMTPGAPGEVVWSASPTQDGRSASRATTHGGFDDDAPTMNSVLRRILDREDADAIVSFPGPSGSRDGAREWSAEVDWPDVLDSRPAPPRFAGVSPPSPAAPVAAATPGPSTGRRKAVCVGINTYPTAPLGGCVADATQWDTTLRGVGFETTLVTDRAATRERILKELSTLIGGSRAGDTLVFQYAGHGTQVEDLDGDEAGGDTPGQDEAICPVDFDRGAFVIDDDIAEEVAKLPDRVRLTFLLDCCHSGTGSRFAGRGPALLPQGVDARARYIVATPEMLAEHRRFRAANGPAGGNRGVTHRAPAAMREVTFAACQSDEVAWEVAGQGEFTRRAHDVMRSGPAGMSNAAFYESLLRAFGPQARQRPHLDCDVSLRSAPWLGIGGA